MVCWLARRVVHSACLKACGGGGTQVSQARDGVYKLQWLNLDFSSQDFSFTTKRYSTGICQPGLLLLVKPTHICSSHSTTTALYCGVSKGGLCVGHELVKAQASTMSSKTSDDATTAMTSKRTGDVLSPVRPQSQKKVRGGHKSPQRSTRARALELDFIPFPVSSSSQKVKLSDIPLPPTSPSNSFGDFFIIDTTPSAVVFPEESVSNNTSGSNGSAAKLVSENKADSSKGDTAVHSKNNRKFAKHGGKHKRTETASCDDDILCIASSSKCEKSKLLNSQNGVSDSDRLLNKIRSRRKTKTRESLSNDSDIDVLFEGLRDMEQGEITVMCTVAAHGSHQDTLLSSVKSSSSHQPSRKCHSSTRHRLKSKVSDEQPEEVITIHPKDVETQKLPNRSQREASPDIQKIDIIDPDVVEIEDSPASCSSSPHNVEVVELYDSGTEDNQSNKSSDHEPIDMDISTTDYISIQNFSVQVKELKNREIDLSDETLDLRRTYENLRKWDLTGLGQDVLSGRNCKPSDTMFTVMSYNVLAQTLLRDNMGLYKDCSEEHLSWAYRWALLQHEITQLDPDILLCQEIEASHYHSHFLPWLTFKGYEALYKKRTGLKADGCAIFFKKNKFSLLEHTSVEYLQPEASNILDRDNIGLIAKLSPVSQPAVLPLCVATTHLLYNPRRHDVKLAQVVLLLSEIDRLAFQEEKGGRVIYCPVLVSGDFNAEPHSTVVQFMKSGRLHYEGLARRTLTRHGSRPGDEVLGPELIPSSLGLTDRCQHSVLAQSRFLEQSRGPIFSLQDKRKLEENLIHLYHSDHTDRPCRKQRSSSTSTQGGPVASGWVSHGFNFNSVYRHRAKHMGGGSEATTKHNGWTSVDYIFYSRQYSKSLARPVEGNLKMLARYRLLSGLEAERFGPLPAAVCPSDHFPLAAQFLLRR